MEKLGGIILFLILGVSGEIRLTLDTSQLDGSWIVWNQNRSIQTAARVPGGIYTDLLSGGVLQEDLFYRFNDIGYRWVAKDNWTYETVFDMPSSMLNKTAVNLVFHGVDTIADLILNGMLLRSTDNMFVRYVMPIKGIVKNEAFGSLAVLLMNTSIHFFSLKFNKASSTHTKKYYV